VNSLWPVLKLLFGAQLDAPVTDKALEFAHKVGKEAFDKIVDNHHANFMSQIVRCHGDPHVFNILVESKPSIETLKNFGPYGDMVVVDFEMAHIGTCELKYLE
jgi:thiamine kinase-like enzyme